MATPKQKKTKSIVTITDALNKVQKGTTKISNVTFSKSLIKHGTNFYPKDQRHSIASLREL